MCPGQMTGSNNTKADAFDRNGRALFRETVLFHMLHIEFLNDSSLLRNCTNCFWKERTRDCRVAYIMEA